MSGNLKSAMEPLLALDGRIRCTQSELQSLRVDTIQQKEEEKSIHRTQQAELDSIQSQVRDLSQQLAEVTEAITELLTMDDTFEVLLTVLLATSIITLILYIPTLFPQHNLLIVKGPHNGVGKCFTSTDQ